MIILTIIIGHPHPSSSSSIISIIHHHHRPPSWSCVNRQHGHNRSSSSSTSGQMPNVGLDPPRRAACRCHSSDQRTISASNVACGSVHVCRLGNQKAPVEHLFFLGNWPPKNSKQNGKKRITKNAQKHNQRSQDQSDSNSLPRGKCWTYGLMDKALASGA